jgi:asparaginyl-tRNA synthetase
MQNMLLNEAIEKYYGLNREDIYASMKMNTIIREEMKLFLDMDGFIEVNPVIISPISDPLNHPVQDPWIDYYGFRYRLTKSMIFHKQLSMVFFDKIFIFSPNIRVEPLDRKGTGRHLVEFTQLDLEVRNAKREDVMEIAEKMIEKVVRRVMEEFDIKFLNPGLKVFKRPYRKIKYLDAKSEYGEDFELKLSKEMDEPFWIIDIPLEAREFYDKETEPGSGILRDMDLIYPLGYGEAISGGEREYQYERILERIKRKGQNPEEFALLLEAAKKGLYPSAGFGIGIERFVRFLRGKEDISSITLFPKKIGEFTI